jgi:hypothetical protein
MIEERGGLRAFSVERFRSSSHRGLPMDKQTKYEIWLLALGTIAVEAPFLAIAAVMMLS